MKLTKKIKRTRVRPMEFRRMLESALFSEIVKRNLAEFEQLRVKMQQRGSL